VVVGATTLKPGEDTTLALPLLMGMHEGMEGQHVFAVDIRSNDPVEPVKIIRWRFNVKEVKP